MKHFIKIFGYFLFLLHVLIPHAFANEGQELGNLVEAPDGVVGELVEFISEEICVVMDERGRDRRYQLELLKPHLELGATIESRLRERSPVSKLYELTRGQLVKIGDSTVVIRTEKGDFERANGDTRQVTRNTKFEFATLKLWKKAHGIYDDFLSVRWVARATNVTVENLYKKNVSDSNGMPVALPDPQNIANAKEQPTLVHYHLRKDQMAIVQYANGDLMLAVELSSKLYFPIVKLAKVYSKVHRVAVFRDLILVDLNNGRTAFSLKELLRRLKPGPDDDRDPPPPDPPNNDPGKACRLYLQGV